jgi:hypothetical protein
MRIGRGEVLARLLGALAVGAAGVLPGSLGSPAVAERRAVDEEAELLLRFTDPRISESSGLALSPTRDDIVYTHNDSDAAPEFFAVGLDGQTRARYVLRGAAARDWEGMAASVDPRTGRGVLWFADIGDNFDGAWPDISVYRVMEPDTLRDATLPATRYRFRYEDGGRNAEGIMVHPRTGRLYIVSKEFSGSIYQAPARLRTDRVNVLRRVGPAPIMATDAAYAPDGSSFVIRTYFSATVYRAPGEQLARVSMPPLDQAESITYTKDGTALLTGTEGANSPVYRVPLPDTVLAESARGPAGADEGAGEASPGASTEPSSPDPARGGGATGERSDKSAGAAARADEEEGSGSGVPLSAIVIWLAAAVGATAVIAFIARLTR